MKNKFQNLSSILNLVQKFKNTLKNYFNQSKKRRLSNTSCSSHESYYEEAKKAQTESRDLEKALKLYIKAIQHGEKKDSSIKDFASSLHQLGYTKEAVKFMDDCEYYYDGNKDKYFRLRDNLSLQIRPTGKHECRYILLQDITQELKDFTCEQELKSSLFKVHKRIKSVKYFYNLDLELPECSLKECRNILFEFQSYSAAKKTLESFNFQQNFGMNLYWINSNSMRITCEVIDGKNDFEESFVIDNQTIEQELIQIKQDFWVFFGQEIYGNRDSNGFINLLAIHILQSQSQKNKFAKNKQKKNESVKNERLQEQSRAYCHLNEGQRWIYKRNKYSYY